MARKQLKQVGDAENKVRWNKKGTRKYQMVTTLTEVKPKSKSRKKKSTETAKKPTSKSKAKKETSAKRKTKPKKKST